MDIIPPNTIKELLSQHNIRPSKMMGQNFLIDQRALDAIIEHADITSEDIVVEIGPGIGTLTKALASRCKKIIAIEKDHDMVNILEETLKDFANIEVIEGDALRYDIPVKEYKVVANIPYYLTSAIIRKYLESSSKPKEIVLMVQKEVAQRICAQPPDMSILAVSVQFYAKPKIVAPVKKESFWPAPKVNSAIIKIIPFATENPCDQQLFFKIVKAGFSAPRKQIVNNLSISLGKTREEIIAWLGKNTLKPTQRAETLSIENWINLTKSFS
jgi:16S rRNA (adenine1518-N6/adenine1519-N6)-dimethyltransferase